MVTSHPVQRLHFTPFGTLPLFLFFSNTNITLLEKRLKSEFHVTASQTHCDEDPS